ncbi:MAG: ABC transporter permease subunit/CPBP intramembrane protease [Thermoguttaceae bacterium]
MNLSNVRLILGREVRDQLRDRRTLFIIAVLPVMLYPLLGLSLFQIAQFTQEQKSRVLVVGAGKQETTPPLFEHGRFASWLFPNPKAAELFELHFDAHEPGDKQSAESLQEDAREQVRLGAYDAALSFSPKFADQLSAFRKSMRDRSRGTPAAGSSAKRSRGASEEVPVPEIIGSTASDNSQMACARLYDVRSRWTQRLREDTLELSGVPKSLVRPAPAGFTDVASPSRREGAMWSKILPVLLLLWALTGAFYPAIDLCAGEKERGTLETLLSSPAARSEIVLAKLMTVMLFSAITAVLNLVTVGLTGWTILARLPGFGLPPPAAILALCVALVPVAALFGALCLALAAFARSTREGQYYLMPLLFLTMPLVILPMSPGVKLTLGNSLIPVTGIVLLLRSMLEGDYLPVLQFAPAVAGVTIAACILSIRWAVEQFNSESVLFCDSERLDLRLWIRHLFRDRGPTPTVAAALCCGLVIVMLPYVAGSRLAAATNLNGFVTLTLLTQLGMIAAPAVLMTLLFTRSPRQTLLLRLPAWWTIPAAILLAVALHPSVWIVKSAIDRMYPMNNAFREAMSKLATQFGESNIWLLLLLLALMPAVCEEIAFRGFVLSGFRHLGHKWRAIILSAVMFGLAHGVLQQSLSASLIGVVIGYLAVQSGSILPGMVFHLTYNSLVILNGSITAAMLPAWAVSNGLAVAGEKGGCQFGWPVVLGGAAVGLLLLLCFRRLRCVMSAEESLTEAIGRASAGELL